MRLHDSKPKPDYLSDPDFLYVDEKEHVQRLLQILQELSRHPMKFTALSDTTVFSNAVLSRYLNKLERLGYIKKNENGEYMTINPKLAAYLREKE